MKFSDDQIAEVRAKAAGVRQNEASISIDLPTQMLSGSSGRIPESKPLIDISLTRVTISENRKQQKSRIIT